MGRCCLEHARGEGLGCWRCRLHHHKDYRAWSVSCCRCLPCTCKLSHHSMKLKSSAHPQEALLQETYRSALHRSQVCHHAGHGRNSDATRGSISNDLNLLCCMVIIDLALRGESCAFLVIYRSGMMQYSVRSSVCARLLQPGNGPIFVWA